MVAFATIATVIASQAIISGAYSLAQQAMQLGFLPRMRVRHTASHEKGQIYIPVVNWLLAVGTLTAVLLFGSSDALGEAYGIAVAMLMAITTVLAAFVALKWGYNPLLVVVANGFFLVIEVVFVAANMTKLVEGGWFPLLMASVIAFLMLTWRAGWRLLEQERLSCASRRTRLSSGSSTRLPFGCRGGGDLHRGDHRDPALPDPSPVTQSRAT
jgi:KUP system potassium uptake protein